MIADNSCFCCKNCVQLSNRGDDVAGLTVRWVGGRSVSADMITSLGLFECIQAHLQQFLKVFLPIRFENQKVRTKLPNQMDCTTNNMVPEIRIVPLDSKPNAVETFTFLTTNQRKYHCLQPSSEDSPIACSMAWIRSRSCQIPRITCTAWMVGWGRIGTCLSLEWSSWLPPMLLFLLRDSGLRPSQSQGNHIFTGFIVILGSLWYPLEVRYPY